MDRAAWRATVHRVAKSRTCLSMHAHKDNEAETAAFYPPKQGMQIQVPLESQSRSVVSDSLRHYGLCGPWNSDIAWLYQPDNLTP